VSQGCNFQRFGNSASMKISVKMYAVAMAGSVVVLSSAMGYEEEGKKKENPVKGHVFGWPFLKAEEMQPRGGTSMGGKVTLFEGVKPEWKKLQEKGLSAKEKDRRAILAMQGAYRVSFDFIETIGFTADYKPPKPYFSWGTERVIVLEDKPGFISLQHVMVMYFKDKEGKETGPHVMKHWRQDWTYQDRSMHQYVGEMTWKKAQVKKPAGAWTQAVYQVDDSPRYEVVGKWDHTGGKSTWKSEPCWRPLPRREFSVRKDYNVLGGVHEITLTPNGWVHMQNNRKLNVAGGKVNVIAHELGINRYEEISAPDLKAGDAAFKQTDPYWAEVRKKWAEVYAKNESFKLQKAVEKKLWMYHFEYAMNVQKHGWKPEVGKKHAVDTVEKFLVK